MPSKDLTFRLLGSDVTASKSLSRLSVAAGRTGEQFKRTFGGTAKVLGGVGLAAAGAAALIVKTGVGEAMDASKGMAQLQAGIKSTGGAAGVTVGHMENLASSIQSMSGQTDDSVVQAEQLLLTFRNIKNQGPNKVFDEATLAASNMAAKMGGDASKYAVQLGKALNDPAAGVAKLTKVGVTFTEEQKKQIKAMEKAGNTAGAQKVILGELNKEFGGAAKAAGGSLPGQLARVQRAFEDVSQTVVESILPIVTPAIEKVRTAITASLPTLLGFVKAFVGFGSWVVANADWLGPIVAGIVAMVAAFKIYVGIVNIVKLATEAWTTVQTLLNITMDANPIGIIVLAIGILVTAIILLVTHWKQVCAFLQVVWGAVCKWFADTLTTIGALWGKLWRANQILFQTVWHAITGFFKSVWDGIVNWFRASANAYYGFWRAIWNNVVNFFRTALDRAVAVARALPGRIMGFFRNAGTWLLNAGRNVIQGLINGIRNTIGGVTSIVSNIANSVVGTFKNILGIHSPSTVFTEHGRNIVQGLVNGLNGNQHLAHAAIAGLVPGLGAGGTVGVNVAGATVRANSAATAANGSGGFHMHLTVSGAVVGNEATLGKVVFNAVQQAVRVGAVPKNGFQTFS